MEIENHVIAPDNVRAALEKTFFAINPDTAYSKGEMGCAQETFTEILTHIHREYVFPEYLEQWINIESQDQKFQLGNKLDDSGCTPKCSGHLTFGVETCDLTSCSKCEYVDGISNMKLEFI